MAEKNQIVENIKKAGREVLFSEVHSIESEQWGTTIYFRNPSIAQQDKYLAGMAGQKLEAYVDLIITLALQGENSNRSLFQKSDKTMLLNQADPEEVLRIALGMLEKINENMVDEEEAGKSLEETEG